MRPYVVRQGDYLFQLAHRFGFDAGEVWSHARNEALRRTRSDPQQLAPGDILFIPDAPPEPLAVRRGATNSYRAEVPTVEVHFTLRQGEEGIANEPFEVRGAGERIRGTTDSEGRLHARVPVNVRLVELFFPELRARVPVLVGGIDPLSTASGVHQRLANLGMLGWTTHLLDARAPMQDEDLEQRALESFQRLYGLPITGQLDAATREAIGEAHEGRRQPAAGQGAGSAR